MDVDVVCSMSMDQVSRFVSNLAGDYYVSLSAAQAAIRSKSCFNLIHLATSFKVDVFVSRGRPSDVESMRRATLGKLGVTRTLEVPIATAEDMIISKLEWFQLTGRTSERQWNDVSRLLLFLGTTADVVYLRQVADSVGVRDLLEQALTQS